MATANKFLEQPARGSNVGVWDTPVNGNFGIIDNAFGGLATIALTNAPVILSSAQYQCMFITFTGALSGNCAITFPSVGSVYTIQNLTSNTSAFQVTLTTTGSGFSIGCPWGEAFDIMTTATGITYRNLGRVGTLWDYAGSSVPAWVSACSIAPWIPCDGGGFSTSAYPNLAMLLGTNVTPDLRGRYRATLNEGTGRITSGSSTGGVDGNTNLSTGGSQTTTLSSQNIPPVPITDAGHTHGIGMTDNTGAVAAVAPIGSPRPVNLSYTSCSATTGIVAGNTSPTNFSNLPPTAIVGITMIRAA